MDARKVEGHDPAMWFRHPQAPKPKETKIAVFCVCEREGRNMLSEERSGYSRTEIPKGSLTCFVLGNFHVCTVIYRLLCIFVFKKTFLVSLCDTNSLQHLIWEVQIFIRDIAWRLSTKLLFWIPLCIQASQEFSRKFKKKKGCRSHQLFQTRRLRYC